MTPAPAALVPETDGEIVPLLPAPETEAALLAARAEPVACPEDWLGPFRDVPREPVAACASDWVDAPDMSRPTSARAPLLNTPEVAARVPVTDGEMVPLAPEPDTEAAGLAARAEPVACPEDWLGRFRAVPREPVAAWAIDWEGAANWEWPATAWAGLLRTPEAAARVAEAWGAKDLLEFAALGALEEVAARAEAEEGAPDACGVARAVLWPVAERAMDCADAALMVWLFSA